MTLEQLVHLRREALERQVDVGKEARIEGIHVVLASLRAVALADGRLEQVHWLQQDKKETNMFTVHAFVLPYLLGTV